MSDYRKLLSLFMRSEIGGLFRKSGREKHSKREAAVLVQVIAVIMLVFFLITGEKKLFDITLLINQPELVPSLTMLASVALTLVLGFFQMYAALYTGRDNRFIATLPVSPRAAMGAKFTMQYMVECLINFVITLPAMIMLGVHISGGVMFYIRGIISVLLVTVLPLVISGFLAGIASHVSSFTRRREAWNTVMMCVFLVAVMALSFMSGNLSVKLEEDPQQMAEMMMKGGSMVDAVTGGIFTVRLAIEALTGNYLSLLLLLAVSAAAAALYVLIMGKGYISSCMKQTETSLQRENNHRKISYEAKGKIPALISREFREIRRSSVYAMNTFVMALLPVIIIAMLLVTDTTGELIAIAKEFLSGCSSMVFVMIAAICMMFCIFVAPVSSTTISREGRHFQTFKQLPVKTSTILTAKVILGMEINGVSTLIVAAAFIYIAPMRALLTLAAVLLTEIFSCSTTAIAITIDCLNPKLHWENETQAMKQNMSAVWNMLVSLLFMGILALPVMMYSRFPVTSFVLSIGLLLAEGVLGLIIMKKAGVPALEKLEYWQ